MLISKTPYRISFFGGGSDYPNFYKKYGFASCFECDEIFTNLDELAKHQEEHLIKEQTLG